MVEVTVTYDPERSARRVESRRQTVSIRSRNQRAPASSPWVALRYSDKPIRGISKGSSRDSSRYLGAVVFRVKDGTVSSKSVSASTAAAIEK